jgi:tetratricopeptide (TPR) repeat protein
MPASRIDYEPGTAFKYANDGFGALQILVEDVTGQSFTDISRSVIFDPLGMKHSTFEQPLSPEKGLYAAAGHDNDGAVNDIKRYAYPILAAGGLWSTSKEFATFVIEIQRALKKQSDLIMFQESARQMVSPHEAKQYGFGVFLRNTDNVTYFSHIGDLKEFAAGFAAHRSDGYGAVVMTNSHNGINLIREITSGIAQIYNWEGFLPKPYVLYNLASATMSKYAGRYRAGFDYCYTVSEKEDGLFWSAPDGAEFRLYPISKDTLISRERRGQVVFVTGLDGEVSKCIFLFADNIGRLPAKETEALRMSEGELTPLEMLLSGQTAQATKSYKERKENLSNDFSVSENRLNNLGYQFLNQNKINEALEVFRLNTVLYPKSANCWDSYAEALLTAGRKQDALLNYQKAYDLDPSSSGRAEKVRRLKSEL